MAGEAASLIERLGLIPHPEGGHYRETYRAPATAGQRSPVTLIHFLLQAGELSHWHRVDATEIWLFAQGAPLLLETYDGKGPVRQQRLGADLAAGELLQAVIAPQVWQAARCLGAWTLASCCVAPGFDFAGFELAPPGWRPGTA